MGFKRSRKITEFRATLSRLIEDARIVHSWDEFVLFLKRVGLQLRGFPRSRRTMMKLSQS